MNKEEEIRGLFARVDRQLEEMHKTRDIVTSTLARHYEEIARLSRRVDAIEAKAAKKKEEQHETK